MSYIHLYKGSPTSGAADGTLVSEGDGSSPITLGPLNATSNEESSALKLGIRCETGYVTAADVVITPTGTTAAKWALAPDNGGTPGTFGAYGAALTITSVINATNTIFWAKAKATSGETPANDTSVDLVVTCATVNPA